MRQRWFYVLTLALLIVFASPDALAAKKLRGGKKASNARAKKEPRGKASRGRVAKNDRKSSELSRRESKHLSRRERKELARSGRGGRAKQRYVARGKRGRSYVSYRERRRNDTEVAAAPSVPRLPTGISAERVTEIQHALIKAGYMEGAATGQYDEITIQAMKQFQAANRLPETGTPTAVALKKLGVSKRSNDGYAVPVNSVSESERKPLPQVP
jgi:Putative peptidoglycan binding domain